MTDAELAWVAGILEGEGSFTITHTKHGVWEGTDLVLKDYQGLRIRCSMTDQDIIYRLFKLIGIGTVTGPTQRGDHKPIWRYNLSVKSEVYELGLKLYPWMGERRQAQIREQQAVWSEGAIGLRA